MDKTWMKMSKSLKEYEDGVGFFLRFANENGVDPSMISCPCIKCSNLKKIKEDDVRGHLYFNGIDTSYDK